MFQWLKRMFAGGWVNKDPGDDYWYTPRGVDTVAGESVNEGKALGIPTVYACVSKIAKTVASLPVQVYDKPNPDTRKPVDHPVNELFAGTAYDEASGMTVSETRMLNLLLWGMGYSFIEWNYNQTEPMALLPMQSEFVEPKRRDDGSLVFEYREPDMGKPEVIPADRMFWVPGLSIGGLVGLSPIRYHRDTVGLMLAKRKFGGSFFKNGATLGGFIMRSAEADRMTPLSKDGAQALLASFNDMHQGAGNAFKWGLLREDMQPKQLVSMPLEDAQYVEGMEFDREDICGIYDCPPSKIQVHKHSTFSNIEHLGIDWATDTILPWCVRVEQAVKRTFFRDTKLYLKHNLVGIARGDLKTRYEAYATGRNWGWLSINDVRRLEDMNPIDEGDDYLQPLNMQVVGAPPVVAPMPVGQADDEPPEDDEEPEEDDTQQAIRASVDPVATDEDRRKVLRDMQPMIAAVCRDLLEHEAAAVEKAHKRLEKKGDASGMDDWLAKFAANRADEVAAAVSPIVATYERLTGAFACHDAAFIGKAWASGMQDGIKRALDAGDLSGQARRQAVNDQAAWIARIIFGGDDNE